MPRAATARRAAGLSVEAREAEAVARDSSGRSAGRARERGRLLVCSRRETRDERALVAPAGGEGRRQQPSQERFLLPDLIMGPCKTLGGFHGF